MSDVLKIHVSTALFLYCFFYRYRHDILHMEQATISEIRSYHHPPKGVHETMICSYLLLGKDEKYLLVS